MAEAVGEVVKVSGPLVVARNLQGANMYELVRVGLPRLYGEVIEIRGELVSVQVYEETEGIKPGEPVVRMMMPLSVELGPGLIGSIYDGVQRPLDQLRAKFGDFVIRGAENPALNREKRWRFEPVLKAGDPVTGGDVLGVVQETVPVKHKIMVPPGVSGKLVEIAPREARVEEIVAVVQRKDGSREELSMMQRWPVRISRPVAQELAPEAPMATGQRVIDYFFPLARGGAACVPGPFGSGKTVVQHQLAKWAAAQIIVYVGCGERGNEMTDVLLEFPELVDPQTGRPLMERTVLVANTSNMPVAAREASVYTGITMAEYFRDMGYSVALMADSTSRWAEAMREMSGRLEEMPGEEGYPAYLVSRLASFYERSGRARCLGAEGREGSLTVIGSVSPPGGDFSEPVVQGTLRLTKVFWGLDDKLAFQRHFPAINWLTSYSLYQEAIDRHCNEEVDPAWSEHRRQAMAMLKREAELEEIVRLVGMDSLAPPDRLLLEGAKMVREDFLHQNAFEPTDTYTSLGKQYRLLSLILGYHQRAQAALDRGAPLEKLLELPVKEKIARAKLIAEDRLEQFDRLQEELEKEVAAASASGEGR
jgi:V/A-type H+-transporting ATPase subunit A